MYEQEPEKDVTKEPEQLFWPFVISAVIVFIQYFILHNYVTAVLSAIGAMAYIGFCLQMGSIDFEHKAFRMDALTPNEDKYYTGGIYFIWWPFQRFVKIQTEPIEIDIEKQEIITDEKGGDSKAAIIANAFVYLYTPSNAADLIKFAKFAPEIKHEKNGGVEFGNFFKPHIVSMIRRVSGSNAWSSIQKDSPEFKAAVHEAILHGDEDNPMKKAGIPTVQVSFESLDLGELSKNITRKQIAEYEKQETEKRADAAKYLTERNADAAKYATERQAEADATATRKKRAAEIEMKKKEVDEVGNAEVEIKKKRLQAMDEHPEMAKIDVYREASSQAKGLLLSMSSDVQKDVARLGGMDEMIKYIPFILVRQFLDLDDNKKKLWIDAATKDMDDIVKQKTKK